ncbi:hypothetical protein [Acutalibacter intestini]|jgi:hypothetical protein|uniref:hypothetical protein n=1 Tax=Acutalibacter intestini TaxID=3093659 RepID=UPI002AC95C7B|nr:hypothetical protein [Acutalibacter sp. M00204]
MNPCERLANAIVLRAVEDYRDALKRLAGFPHDRDSNRTKAEVERFFRSGWFSALTSLDSEMLIEKLTMEVSA